MVRRLRERDELVSRGCPTVLVPGEKGHINGSGLPGGLRSTFGGGVESAPGEGGVRKGKIPSLGGEGSPGVEGAARGRFTIKG